MIVFELDRDEGENGDSLPDGKKRLEFILPKFRRSL